VDWREQSTIILPSLLLPEDRHCEKHSDEAISIGEPWRARDCFAALAMPATPGPAAVRWVTLDDAAAMIATGEIAGAATVIGVQCALMLRAGVRLPGR